MSFSAARHRFTTIWTTVKITRTRTDAT